MIEYYRRIGLRMYRIRYLLMVLIVAFALVVANLIFGDSVRSERFLLPAMVLTTWLVLCLSFAYYFAGLKPGPDPGAGWYERFTYSIHRAFSYLLAVLFTIASLLLLYFTATAARVAMSA